MPRYLILEYSHTCLLQQFYKGYFCIYIVSDNSKRKSIYTDALIDILSKIAMFMPLKC